MRNFLICGSFGLLTASSVWANGLILNDEHLRDDLNWLNQQGVIQISTSTWPLSEAEVSRVLNDASVKNHQQQLVVDTVKQTLKNQHQLATLSVFAESDRKDIPQAFADQEKAQLVGALTFNAGGEHWAGRLQVNAEKDQQIKSGDDINVEGSFIAGKLWNQWLVAGQIPVYWGPGHDGSLIRGDASRPVTGITLQRAEQAAFDTKWLSWLGPWQYQAFAGQLNDYRAVPDAKLIGLRLTAQPFQSLELGASRVIQWGGKGRPQSLSSFWDAWLGTRDNIEDPNEVDPSNQMAGIDARLNLNSLTGLPIGLYGQMVGEDEAGGLPSRKLYLAGIDYSSVLGKMPYQLYLEWADTRTNGDAWGYTYNHHTYKDGYYQHGFPLGHAAGGDAEMVSLGGFIKFDPMNRVNGRLIYADLNQSNRKTNAAFPEKDKIKAVDLSWTHQITPLIPLTFNGWVSDSDKHGNDSGVSAGIELPLDAKAYK